MNVVQETLIETTLLDQISAERLLSKYELKMPRQGIVYSEEEAVNLAKEFGSTVVLKIADNKVLHKTDVGGVKLNLAKEIDVRAAYYELVRNFGIDSSEHFHSSVLVQEMLHGDPPIELIFGAKKDETFGMILLFGVGGVQTEMYKDTAMCVDPWEDQDLKNMIGSIKAQQLLDGYRGSKSIEREKLFQFAKQLELLVKENPQIVEIDLNPIIQTQGKLVILDAKINTSGNGFSVTKQRRPTSLEEVSLLLKPRSIAVIGASNDPQKIGGMIIPRLVKFGFNSSLIFPVNPNQDKVSGLTCYKSVDLIPEPVDLACILVPAIAVAGVVEQLGRKGVRSALVFSSGFSESGKETLQKDLQSKAAEYGIRLCGPNSEGIVSTSHKTFVSFSQRFDYLQSLESGSSSIVSQSGGISTYVALSLAEQNAGFSSLVSTGNEVDLELSDFLKFFALDSETKAVGAFVEGIRNGPQFVDAVKALNKAGKPLVVYKSGKASKGAIAAGLHTGALAGSYSVFQTLMRQLGVIEAQMIGELGDILGALFFQPLPRGDRLVVASASGGVNTIIADWCETRSIKLQVFDENKKAQLAKILPDFGAGSNPLDFTAQAMSNPSIMSDTLELLADEGDIFVVVMIGGIRFAKAYLDICSPLTSRNKTVITCWLSPRGVNEDTRRILLEQKLPVYSEPTQALRVVEALLNYSKYCRERAPKL